MTIHNLTEIDEDARTALCSSCGSVSIRKRKNRPNWYCQQRLLRPSRGRPSKLDASAAPEIARLYTEEWLTDREIAEQYGVTGANVFYFRSVHDIDRDESLKRCSKCKEVKSRAEFGQNTSRYDGLQSCCKPCTSAMSYAWQLANQDKGYYSVHSWIARHGQKTGICSDCGEERVTEWSNVDHEYRREIEDWVERCKTCHFAYDREVLGVTRAKAAYQTNAKRVA